MDEKISDEVEWSANFYHVNIDDLNEDTGLQLQQRQDFVYLMFDAHFMTDFVRHTTNYVKWKWNNQGEVDSVLVRNN